MSFRLTLAFFSALITISYSQLLSFENGDQLSGTPTGLNADGQLEWFSEVLGAPIVVDLLEVERLSFAPALSSGSSYQESSAEILLNRGDRILGEILTIQDHVVRMRTEWSDELLVQREMIARVNFLDKVSPYLSNSNLIRNWLPVINRKSWIQGQDSLTSRGRAAVCRESQVGERMHISFGARISMAPRLKLLLFANEGRVYEPESYLEFVIQRNSVVSKVRREGEISSIGQANGLDHLQQNRELMFDLYVDAAKNTFTVYIDKKKVSTWALPENLALGRWTYLFSEYDGEVEVSDLEILKWNGALPYSVRDHGFVQERGKPLFLLRNGDYLNADVVAHASDAIVLDTELGEVKVPQTQLEFIDYSSGEYNEAIRAYKDARFLLRDGSIMIFQLKSWNENEVVGGTQNIDGEIILPIDYIQAISFNLYD